MIVKHYLELVECHSRFLILMVIFSAAAFGGAGIYKLHTSPEYTASANVTMLPTEAELAFSRNSASSRVAAQTLSETYMEYVRSRPVIENALRKIDAMSAAWAQDAPDSSASFGSDESPPVLGGLRLDWLQPILARAGEIVSRYKRRLTEFDKGSYVELPEAERRIERIRDAISVDNVASTHILRIRVTLDDPKSAALVANTLADAYVERMSEQSNSEANELEGYLREQIEAKDDVIAGLRAERSRLAERFGVVNDQSGVIDDRLAVEEAQLAELHSRLLTVNLSRASSSAQVRVVEPAIEPAYPSSPSVIGLTQTGILVGFLLAAASIVIRDALSDTVKTSSDLYRLVGSRGIGLFRRPRFRRVPRGAVKRLGHQLQQHFALSHLSGGGAKRKSQDDLPSLEAPRIPTDPFGLYGYSDQPSDGSEVVVSGPRVFEKLGDMPFISANEMFVQVTGLMPMKELCWATIQIAAAMASLGNKVYCVLPDGIIRKPPRLKFRYGGEVVYDDPLRNDDLSGDYMQVQCLGPMNARFDIERSMNRNMECPIICILPRDQIPDRIVEAMKESFEGEDPRNWHFLLMG